MNPRGVGVVYFLGISREKKENKNNIEIYDI
jgi:hypothetical protein